MSAEGFERVWVKTLEGIEQTGSAPSPTPKLKPLLGTLYDEACRRPPDAPLLDKAIESVLRFLASSDGRTHDNCWVTSNFIMPGDDFWEVDWGDLPENYVKILGIMGHELWQAVENAEWCENFGGSPEQLLDQLGKT